MRVEGLEPPRLAAPEPKSGASTNFATPASPVRSAGLTRSIAKLAAKREGENRGSAKIIEHVPDTRAAPPYAARGCVRVPGRHERTRAQSQRELQTRVLWIQK